MPVNWNLAGPGFNAMEVLNAASNARKEQYTWNKLERQDQQEQRSLDARRAVAGDLQHGDYGAATNRALEAGDFDLAKHIGGLQMDHRKQLVDEATHIAGLAYSLRGQPPEQRHVLAMQTAQQFGIDPSQIPNDLSDASLASIYGWATDVKDQAAAALTEARTADVSTDNLRQDRLANNTIGNSQARLTLARNGDARDAARLGLARQARGEASVRFRERDKDRAAIAAGGRGIRTDTDDLRY